MNSKLDKEWVTNISMELIGISGESRGYAMRALKFAQKGDILKAEEFFKIAKNKLNEVHRIHADIISKEAQGNEILINVLFIHSQDHFSNALLTIDLLEYMIDLYKRVNI